ncbi:MAG: ScyD/ScyE family protein [Nocardioides sp.]
MGATLAVVPSAAQGPSPTRSTLASGLLSPLSLAVAEDGTTFYSENFAGVLHRRSPQGKDTVIYRTEPGIEVGAVSEQGGSLRFALSGGENEYGVLMAVGNSGVPVRIANLMAHEKKHNPDGDVQYGFRDLDEECVAQFPQDQEEGIPVTYMGSVETHPYATWLGRGGTTFIADAGANAIFAVSKPKRVRTIAALPPTPLMVTAELAGEAGLPECAVGHTYWVEAVPTDVEKGQDGKLYVTSLPGGPEGGAPGSVYRVNPANGAVKLVATGLVSPVGIAVGAGGDLYVSELFRGRIARIPAGTNKVRPFIEVGLPGDIESTSTGWVFTAGTLTGLSGEPGDDPAGSVVRLLR